MGSHRPGMAFLVILLIASCADPTAVQKFSQLAPPADEFHSMLVDFANLPIQGQAAADVIATGSAQDEVAARNASDQFCGQINVLDRMHAAMVAYMNTLGTLATAGTTTTPSSTSQSGSAATAVAGSSPSPTTSSSGQGLCQPPPINSEARPTAAAQPAASPGADPAAGANPTAASLTTDLQSFAKAFNGGKTISQGEAGAAGSLGQLVVDLATTFIREKALHNALADPYYTAFLSAISIERKVITYGLAGGTGHSDDLAAYKATLNAVQTRIKREKMVGNQRAADQLTDDLLYETWRGSILTPIQVSNLEVAAQNYLSALKNLEAAYITLHDTSATGDKVLTASMWKTIQPLLSDVSKAYAALGKIWLVNGP